MGLFYGVVAMAAKAFWDDDDPNKPTVETDRRSSDFGKVRLGGRRGVRIDPLAGLSQVTVFATRMLKGQTKSSYTGRVASLTHPEYGKQDWLGVGAQFMRQKLAPWPGAVVSYLSGAMLERDQRTGRYLPATPANLATQMFYPLSVKEIYEQMRKEGVPKGTALGLLVIFGVGVQNYKTMPNTQTGQ